MSAGNSKEYKKKPIPLELLHDIKNHRKIIASLIETMDQPGIAENLSDSLTLDNDTIIPVEIFRPTNSTLEFYPTIFHIPGSGFNTLNPYFAFITCSQLAMHSGCQVIVINHTLAPEHPFPEGQDTALAVFHQLMRSALSLKIDLSKVALSGYSSGGTYAAWIANQEGNSQIREQALADIKHLFLISPVVDLSSSMPRTKVTAERHDHVVKQRFVDGMKKFYLQGIEDLNDPKLSPYLQPEIKKNHPPTHFTCGEFDRFASDTKNYAEKLADKTKVTSTIIKGGRHNAFWHQKEAILDIASLAKQSIAVPIPRPVSTAADPAEDELLHLKPKDKLAI